MTWTRKYSLNSPIRERERERERNNLLVSNSQNNSFGGYFGLKKLFTFNIIGGDIFAFLGSVDSG